MLPIKQRRVIHADIAKELLKLGTSGVRCVNIAEHYTMACKDVEEMEIDLTAIAIDHWQEAVSKRQTLPPSTWITYQEYTSLQ